MMRSPRVLVADALGAHASRDDEGRLIIGSPERGCRHCGSVTATVAAGDRLVWYHPSTECCRAAIADQMSYRYAEIEQLKARIREKQEALDQLAEEASMYDPNNRSTEATKAHARLRLAEQRLAVSTKEINARIKELYGEVKRLTAKSETF